MTVGSDGQSAYRLLPVRGAGVATFIKDTVGGPVTPPTANLQFTTASGVSQTVTWVTDPLGPVTIAGSVTFNLFAFESANQANATIGAELLRLDGSGNILSVVATVISSPSNPEIGIGKTQVNWSTLPSATTLNAGDCLAMRIYVDDGNGVTMTGSGRNVGLDFNGASPGLFGDSFITLTEALSVGSPTQTPTLTISPTATWTGTVSSTRTPSPTGTASPSVTPSPTADCSSAGTAGKTSTGASSTTATIALVATRFDLPVQVAVQSLAVNFGVLTAGNFIAAIYADDGSGNAPGTLLAQSASTAASVGWVTVAIPPTVLLPGRIWLACNGSSVLVSRSYDASAMGDSMSATFAFGAMPAVFPASTAEARLYDIYLNYCPFVYLSPTPTATRTASPSASVSPSGTSTPTMTATSSLSPSSTPTPTVSGTATRSTSQSSTMSPVDTGTSTWTATPTGTSTASPTASGTSSATPSQTLTPADTGTSTQTTTPTGTATDPDTVTQTGTPSATPNGPLSVSLGRACGFGILDNSGFTNTGTSTLTGDLGSFPTTTEVGLGTLALNGTDHAGDTFTQNAQTDLALAYSDAAGRSPSVSVPVELGGTTLTAGVYNSGTLDLTGTLTLDGGGDNNAVFILQAGSTLVTAAGSRVSLVNGAQAKNVFWAVGSSATLSSSATFKGTILAMVSISLGPNSNIEGGLFALNGAVAIDTSSISTSCGAPSATPTPSATASESPTLTQTETFSATPSPTQTGTSSATLSDSPSPSETQTPTASVTGTSSATKSSTMTPVDTETSTDTATPTETYTPSATASATGSESPSPSETSSATQSSTSTPVDTETSTDTATPTETYTPSATASESPTLTPTETSSATPSPTQTCTASATLSDSPSPSETPTSTASVTGTGSTTPSSTMTPLDTGTSTQTATPTGTCTPSFTATGSPTRTLTTTPSSTPSPTPTASPTGTSSATLSSTGTSTQTTTPSGTCTPSSTATGSPTPSATPTASSSATPSCTSTGTVTSTASPTNTSTSSQTCTPTVTPTYTVTSTSSSTRTTSPTPTISQSFTVSPTFTVTPTFTNTPCGVLFQVAGVDSGVGPAYASTANSLGQNRALVVRIVIGSLTQSVSAMSFAGLPLTRVRRDLGVARSLETWYLVGAPSGVNPLSLTLTGAVAFHYNWASYGGVSQSVPIGVSGFISRPLGSNYGGVTLTSSVTNSIFVASYASDTAGGGGSIVIGPGQVDEGNDAGGFFTRCARLAALTQASYHVYANLAGTAAMEAQVVELVPELCGNTLPSATITLSSTATPTRTVTPTLSCTPTPTLSSTVTGTGTSTATRTATPSPSGSSTVTLTTTGTATATGSPTTTVTVTASSTPTRTPTDPDTMTQTESPTVTGTPTESATGTSTSTLTVTPTPSGSSTVTLTPTSTPTDLDTMTQTESSTVTGTPTDSATGTSTSTLTVTPTPSGSSTVTLTATGTATVPDTMTRTVSPTATVTPTASATGTSSSTLTVTATPSVTRTSTGSSTRTASPTLSATLTVSATRTASASSTGSPTLSPTPSPSSSLTVSATSSVSATVSPSPTPQPSLPATARLPYQVTTRLYDRSGKLVRNVNDCMSAAPITAMVFSSSPYDPSQGPLLISQDLWCASFDGKGDSGSPLQGGVYLVDVESAQAGVRQNTKRLLTIIGGAKSSVSGLLAWPDPVRPGAASLWITWSGGQEAEVSIYNLAGELVRDLGRLPQPPIAWDLRLSGGDLAGAGIYLIRARTPGEKKVVLSKFALLR